MVTEVGGSSGLAYSLVVETRPYSKYRASTGCVRPTRPFKAALVQPQVSEWSSRPVWLLRGSRSAEAASRTTPNERQVSSGQRTLQQLLATESIGYIPPTEAEANYYRRLANRTVEAT